MRRLGVPGEYVSGLRPVYGIWRRAANQAFADVTVTDISWDTEDADSDGMLTPSSATFTLPSAGPYSITVEMVPQFSATVTAQNLYLVVAGTTIHMHPLSSDSTASGTTSASFSITRPFAAGDACKAQFIHNSGSSRNYRARLFVNKLAQI